MIERFDQILSNASVNTLISDNAFGLGLNASRTRVVIRQVERIIVDAVVEKLEAQKPVAWMALDTSTGKTYFIDNEEAMLETAKLERYDIKPLYAHPPISNTPEDSIPEKQWKYGDWS